MVEGDGCHRVAAQHRKSLVGRKFKASSPNGRFRAGASAIAKAGGVLKRIEVHGKNMYYFFGRKAGAAVLVVHVHFGMAGAFAEYRGDEPETTPNTRLRLESDDGGAKIVAHLSAMTVEHGTPAAMYEPALKRLGPDPLRDDASAEAFVRAALVSKKPIGAMLMDQSAIAGVGNIYRSETLYEAAMHPEQPAHSLSPSQLGALWKVIVRQMQDGFKTGSIWGRKKGPACYGRSRSACGGKVREWTMGGRNVYACGKRQKVTLAKQSKGTASKVTKKVRTGTKHLGRVTAAAVAEDRKRKSGEGLGVQHVALKDDATLAGMRAAKAMKRARKA